MTTKKPIKNSIENMTSNQELYVDAESRTNWFNLNVLAIIIVMALLCVLLNELGLFKVDRVVMIPAIVLANIFFSTPILFRVIHDGILKKRPKYSERPFFKYLIIGCIFLGVTFLCVVLSFHSVLILALPPLIGLSYRTSKKTVILIALLSILIVPVTVYGSYYLGAVDRNFIKDIMTYEEAQDISVRVAKTSMSRLLEIGWHYAVPRLLAQVAIVAIAIGINNRNRKLIEAQSELHQQINAGMQKANEMQQKVINVLATLIEMRDVNTGEHVIRTGRYVRMIAEAMAKDGKYKDILTLDEIKNLQRAASLHDVGKISVSDTILLKPGKLTKEEFDQMKVHTTKGREIIEKTFATLEDKPLLKAAEEIALSHHEKWDGSGYPMGLKGEDIPLSARIMAVADVYDALVSVRVYKPAIRPEDAIQVMIADAGTHFDPYIMSIVEQIQDELIAEAKRPVDG
ncbi:MAG: HD domain-containing protein [Clostridia bacterium]|nr:HD domain-containing protein [Clostridia bacterium]